MSTSLYYRLKRPYPLSNEEWVEIQKIVGKYNQDQEIRDLVLNGDGDLFSISRSFDKDYTVLEGATELPAQLYQEDIFDFMFVAESWFHLLSELRNFLSDGIWEARLDDQPLYWNSTTLEFERPK